MTYLPAMKLYTIKIIDWCDLIEVMCDSQYMYIYTFTIILAYCMMMHSILQKSRSTPGATEVFQLHQQILRSSNVAPIGSPH